MTGQTRRKPSVPAPAPQRTAATHASGAHEFSYRFDGVGLDERVVGAVQHQQLRLHLAGGGGGPGGAEAGMERRNALQVGARARHVEHHRAAEAIEYVFVSDLFH